MEDAVITAADAEDDPAEQGKAGDKDDPNQPLNLHRARGMRGQLTDQEDRDERISER